MEIRKLNEFLAHYKIEIICDNCHRQNDHSSRSVTHNASKQDAVLSYQTEKKQTSKSKKISKHQATNTAQRVNSSNQKRVELKSKEARFEPHPVSNTFTSAHKQPFPPRSNIFLNPPNEFLNLNCLSAEGNRRLNLQELMEIQRNTPNKIEDVEVEKYYYSEKKENNFKNNLTNSTTQPLLPCPEESPISNRDRRRAFGLENGSYDRFALAGIPSRDTSPIPMSYQRNIDTPSYRDRTPKHGIHFTPLLKGNDLHDEGHTDQFNLFQNPFGNRY